MAVLALGLYVLWGVIGFGARIAVHRRRTGDTGVRGSGGRPGSAGWWARLLMVAAVVVGMAAPIVDLSGGVGPVDVLDVTALRVAAAAIAVAGIVATFGAQLAMGESWRIGIDPAERTQLVTGGPFGVVRNPIYTAMAMTGLGLALLVPNVVALAGLALLVAGLEMQVRLVEEPYLRSVHGEPFERYARRVGRFVPGLGRRLPT